MRILRVLAWVSIASAVALMGAVGIRPGRHWRYVGRHWQRRGGHRAVEPPPVGSDTMRLGASAVRALRHRWALKQAKGTAEVKP